MNADKTKRCEQCDCDLPEGINLVEVCEGVLGMRGFVPLDEPRWFCSLSCLKSYCAEEPSDDYHLDPRIP